jgi:AcrR family transcriptional regulator
MARIHSRAKAKRAVRAPLNRERVLAAAIKLADEGGLELLSMRKLGVALGVEAMTLYHHFENKEDVLDGIVDIVFGEIDLPLPGLHWKVAMRERARAVRDALARHRTSVTTTPSSVACAQLASTSRRSPTPTRSSTATSTATRSRR